MWVPIEIQLVPGNHESNLKLCLSIGLSIGNVTNLNLSIKLGQKMYTRKLVFNYKIILVNSQHAHTNSKVLKISDKPKYKFGSDLVLHIQLICLYG